MCAKRQVSSHMPAARLAKCCTYVLVSDLINESDRLLRLCNGPPLFHLLYEGHSLFSSLEGNMKKNN